MLILGYFSEGVMRSFADVGVSATLALIETALALVFFANAVFYARLTRLSQPRAASS